MASITINLPGYRNITSSDLSGGSGRVIPSVTSMREERITGVTVSSGNNSIRASYNSSTGVYNFSISGLTAGSAQTIIATVFYDVYTTSYDTVYFFYHNGVLAEGTSLSRMASRYIEYEDRGQTMEPTKADNYDASYGAAYFYTRQKPVTNKTGSGSNSAHKTCYTKPATFTFAGTTVPIENRKWLVSSGIQSLITNIYSFNTEVKKRNNWIAQSSNGASCNAFQKGNLSASMFSTAYSAVGSKFNYKTGDIITAKMFTDLAAAFNATP